MKNTIVSLITPPLMGAVAVIRISGDEALDIASSIFSRRIKEPNKVVFGNIQNGENIVDEVLLTYFKGPKSFTGEDVIEISCHGSMLIANEIISLIISKGARMAERGEFSSRAYANGKIDLVQAEGINSLILSTTAEQKKLAMYSLKGETSSKLSPLITKLADILANIEVNIDYPEYQDIEEVTERQIILECDYIAKEIMTMLNQSKKSQYIVHGVNVALVGLPNAGKSSLLNALLNQNKAIVSSIPGTTRDVVEGNINLGGLPLHLLDTAGIHEASNEIEALGITKSQEEIEKADLVIFVKDATTLFSKEERELLNSIENKKHIVVFNKADLINDKKEEGIYISAINKDVTELKDEILKMFDLSVNDIIPSLCSTREIGLLEKAKEDMLRAKEEAEYCFSLDLISVYIKEAYDTLKEIIGERVSVDLEKEIFSRFCVGK